MSENYAAAAIYVRQSVDTEQSSSIEAQEKACRALASAKGLPVLGVFTDRGVSGGKAIADRPGLSRLLAAAEAGEVSAVVVYSIDRLARSTGVFVELADKLQKIGAPLVIVREALDLSTDAGRMTAELLAVLASAERRLIASRVTAAHERHAQDGRFYGRRAPFGWRAVQRQDGPGLRLALDPVEAPVLQEIAYRVIAGESLTAVCRDVDGAPTNDAVRRLFRKPIIAGHAALHGEIVTGSNGLPLVAHEPLLDATERRALHAALDGRAVAADRSSGFGELRLLNALDLVKCAVCGGPMGLNRQKRHRKAGPYVRISYVCRSGCVSAEAGALEDAVAAAYLAAVGHFTVIERDTVADEEAAEAAEALEAITERRRALASMVADGVMPADDARDGLARLAETAAGLQAIAARSIDTETNTGETFGQRWQRFDIAERRAALVEGISSVTVSKGLAGSKIFDPSRVVVDWNH